MLLNSYLVKNRYGVYYLRIQRSGSEIRRSLRTCDPRVATKIAYFFACEIMAKRPITVVDALKTLGDFNSRWETVVTRDSITTRPTENTEEDHRRAHQVSVDIAKEFAHAIALQGSPAPVHQTILTSDPAEPLMKLGIAVDEYLSTELINSKSTLKTRKQAEVVLKKFVEHVGDDFDIRMLKDKAVKTLWVESRQSKGVKNATIKRDLSYVRNFVRWAADEDRQYCPAPLSLSIEADNAHYEYFVAHDLKKLFDNLPAAANEPWKLWLPLIALFTGSRIGEPAALLVEHFYQKAQIETVFMPGTKTDTSAREIPIHPDLITIGLLDMVASRRQAGKRTLFDIKISSANGAGGNPSKWFTRYRRKVGVCHPMKVFHSFRPTLIDHLKQNGVVRDHRCPYIGHSEGGGAHGMYARNPLGIPELKTKVVDQIDWLHYCGWAPDLAALSSVARKLMSKNI